MFVYYYCVLLVFLFIEIKVSFKRSIFNIYIFFKKKKQISQTDSSKLSDTETELSNVDISMQSARDIPSEYGQVPRYFIFAFFKKINIFFNY